MELHYSSYFWILYQYFQLKIKVQFSVFDLKLITIAAVLMDFICFIPSKISLYFQRAMTVNEMNKVFPLRFRGQVQQQCISFEVQGKGN